LVRGGIVEGNQAAGGIVGLQQTQFGKVIDSTVLAPTRVVGFGATGGIVGKMTARARLVGSLSAAEVSTGRESDGCGGAVGILEDSTIESTTAVGRTFGGFYSYVGGLVGAIRGGTVRNSFAGGPVEGFAEDAGGLVGFVDHFFPYGGTTNGIPTVIEHSGALGNVSGRESVGGLVGQLGVEFNPLPNENHRLSNTFSRGNVTGATSMTGGLVGRAFRLTVESSYSFGRVSGGGGGIVGFSLPFTTPDGETAYALEVTDSYYNSTVNPTFPSDHPVGGEGRSADDLMNISTYPDTWDISLKSQRTDTIWTIAPGSPPELNRNYFDPPVLPPWTPFQLAPQQGDS